ncbi:hypothetical protein SAMN05216389_11011 [Oceanobacillus limi]|uniref:Uncharacterized protein n=1 Tax=Oceanobacillus limi TaxID=930131 RepID=A0A1I0E0S7_9BACI|nr:hypothetical protein [Oceanobacillus limi]SET37759.1 hypothetical protein SAMN05216389_11011 [Oceanobacillus limi]
MGRRRLLTSIAIGAAVGGITALVDRDTREYTKDKLHAAKVKTTYCMKHPSESLHNARVAFDRFNQAFSYQIENAANALEQVENTVEKVSNSNKKIEG